MAGELNRRQESQETLLLDLMLEYGKWDQTFGKNGSHYISQNDNPFIEENICCSVCIFYRIKTRQCDIVKGRIHPDAICKLWIIPEEELGE